MRYNGKDTLSRKRQRLLSCSMFNVEGNHVMNEAGHRQCARDIEQATADLGDPAVRPHICAVLIESFQGASFHWIIVGGMGKHTWHTDSHPGLARHLTTLGEPAIATEWTMLERLRTNGGVYLTGGAY